MDTIFEKVGRYIAIALLGLMGVVVIAAIVELAYEIVTGLIQPPGFFLGVTELLETFGLFLMVLIGLELLASIRMYIHDETIHVEFVMVVALIAVSRKIIVLYYEKTDAITVLGIAALIIALSAG